MTHVKMIFLVLFLPLSMLAQEGMTLDEYRYLTKGFAYQKEMGLDASKAGYTIIEKRSIDEVRIISLTKETLTIPQGLLFIISQKGQKDNYICLPNNQADARVKELFQVDQQNITNYQVRKKFHQAVQHSLFETFVNHQKTAVPHTSLKNQENSSPTIKAPQIIEEQVTSKGAIPDDYDRSLSVKNAQQKQKKSVNTNTQIKIGGALDERSLVVAPVILEEHYQKGLVVIKICVDESGAISQAKYTQKGSTTLDKRLKELALNSAQETIFIKSDRPKSCGTITYHFK